mgnify:CR=1 FL=1
MDYKDIDYSKYLSVDNGKGILLSKEDVLVLKRYDIDYKKYGNLNELIFDIESLLDEEDDEELEDICSKLSEIYYYNYVNK